MPIRRIIAPAITGAVCLSALACGGAPSPASDRGSLAGGQTQRLDNSRFTWLEADCSDGRLPLAELGFEDELRLDVTPEGLLLSEDIVLGTDGCAATRVWSAHPRSSGAHYDFAPVTAVTMPPATSCGATRDERTEGTLALSGELLEVITYGSSWCRGFDARFVFRRSAPLELSAQQLVARYIAHWNRRDADAVAELFAEHGAIVEPFTRTDDGNYRRHEGREAVRAWHESAFASTPWLAMRLVAIESSPTGDRATASWEYMDARLQAPLRGRNLFIIGAGEIFESELQLLSDPEPTGDRGAG